MKGRIDGFEYDREEELSFFRELKKHQNEHIPSLLLCASEDYECDTKYVGNGKFSLYRIPSGRKENGLELLETKNKSDFDWLKTPPATPLFPSLEMEPSPNLVTQKELPITQSISRAQFAKSDGEVLKPKANQTNSTKSSKLAMRSITPSHNRLRPNLIKNTNEQKLGTHPSTTNQINNAKIEHVATNNTKYPNPPKQTNNVGFLALNQKINIEANETHRRPRARGVSPSLKSKGSNIVIELSNETPKNLRIDDKRSISSTRGRSIIRGSIVGGFQNQDSTPKACRPSRSPSPSMSKNGLNQFDRTQKNVKIQKEAFTLAAGNNESRSHFKGSKMVEKVVNARKSGINQADARKSGINQADRESKLKPVKYREK